MLKNLSLVKYHCKLYIYFQNNTEWNHPNIFALSDLDHFPAATIIVLWPRSFFKVKYVQMISQYPVKYKLY